MEQTGIIRDEIGEYVLRFPNRPRIPVQQSGAVRGNTEDFYAAWEEACRAQYGGEPRRAHYFYHQAQRLPTLRRRGKRNPITVQATGA
jgi:hypothetical protein